MARLEDEDVVIGDANAVNSFGQPRLSNKNSMPAQLSSHSSRHYAETSLLYHAGDGP